MGFNQNAMTGDLLKDKLTAILVSVLIQIALFSFWFGSSKAEMQKDIERCIDRQDAIIALIDSLHTRN